MSSGKCSIDENISEVPELLSHQPEMNLELRDTADSSNITQPLENDEKESAMPSTSKQPQAFLVLNFCLFANYQEKSCLNEFQQTTPVICEQNISSTKYPLISDINEFSINLHPIEVSQIGMTYIFRFSKFNMLEYPSLKEIGALPLSVEMGEAELLSEQQLLEFYYNDQLEIIDDFIDSFYEVKYF